MQQQKTKQNTIPTIFHLFAKISLNAILHNSITEFEPTQHVNWLKSWDTNACPSEMINCLTLIK